MCPSSPQDLIARAIAWADADPDPDTRSQLRAAVEREDLDELRAAMATPLAFGTAGLRGRVGPGPARMNRATVIRTSRGLAEHVLRTATVPVGSAPLAVVGFDARPDSPRFARDTVAVLAAAGLDVAWFPEPVPTPLVAYAARVLQASAAVVVTASHNPPADNGYKVFGPTASQIVAPVDVEIAAGIDRVGPALGVPRSDPATDPRVRRLGEETLESYLAELDGSRPAVSAGRDPVIVYTPLHGVAGGLVERALARAGFGRVHAVASQADPDGSFPTVAFPNPEEPGALDEAVAEARRRGADLVLANDPDGDRLAVAVPAGEGYRPLTGNEVGVLLGDHLLTGTTAEEPLVISSIVSTPMFGSVARARGAHHETTLTGFKWICRAALELEARRGWRFVLGYEEALGYAIGGLVRDKDGISAAVAVADMARALDARGGSLTTRLEELEREHGVWVSLQRSVALTADDGGERVERALDLLAGAAPSALGKREVVSVVDHRVAADGQPDWLPPSDLVELGLDGGRALLRPSGTEAKCKVYVDLRGEAGAAPGARRRALLAEAEAVARDVVAHAGLD